MIEKMKQPNIICVEIPGRDRIEYDAKNPQVLKVIGCSQLQELIRALQSTGGDVATWKIPQGNSHSDLLVRELILRARGEWEFPVQEAETCHCRAVPTNTIDQAIVCGAHSIDKVRRLTSANTACGTCFPEVEKILNYRLAKKA
jgi:bacterioferritin-associated ferredoxin